MATRGGVRGVITALLVLLAPLALWLLPDTEAVQVEAWLDDVAGPAAEGAELRTDWLGRVLSLRLRGLDVAGRPLQHADAFETLPALAVINELDLAETPIEGRLDLSRLPELTSLVVADTAIVALDGLDGQELAQLDIGGAPLEEFPAVEAVWVLRASRSEALDAWVAGLEPGRWISAVPGEVPPDGWTAIDAPGAQAETQSERVRLAISWSLLTAGAWTLVALLRRRRFPGRAAVSEVTRHLAIGCAAVAAFWAWQWAAGGVRTVDAALLQRSWLVLFGLAPALAGIASLRWRWAALALCTRDYLWLGLVVRWLEPLALQAVGAQALPHVAVFLAIYFGVLFLLGKLVLGFPAVVLQALARPPEVTVGGPRTFVLRRRPGRFRNLPAALLEPLRAGNAVKSIGGLDLLDRAAREAHPAQVSGFVVVLNRQDIAALEGWELRVLRRRLPELVGQGPIPVWLVGDWVGAASGLRTADREALAPLLELVVGVAWAEEVAWGSRSLDVLPHGIAEAVGTNRRLPWRDLDAAGLSEVLVAAPTPTAQLIYASFGASAGSDRADLLVRAFEAALMLIAIALILELRAAEADGHRPAERLEARLAAGREAPELATHWLAWISALTRSPAGPFAEMVRDAWSAPASPSAVILADSLDRLEDLDTDRLQRPKQPALKHTALDLARCRNLATAHGPQSEWTSPELVVQLTLAVVDVLRRLPLEQVHLVAGRRLHRGRSPTAADGPNGIGVCLLDGPLLRAGPWLDLTETGAVAIYSRSGVVTDPVSGLQYAWSGHG